MNTHGLPLTLWGVPQAFGGIGLNEPSEIVAKPYASYDYCSTGAAVWSVITSTDQREFW